MKKRLYISIPITGVEEKSKIKAEQLQKHFEADGYEVINPFEIGMHLEKLHDLCGHKPPTWEITWTGVFGLCAHVILFLFALVGLLKRMHD